MVSNVTIIGNKTFVGNGKKIVCSSNTDSINVIGNLCRVQVGQNKGRVKIVGNGGHIQISKNFGDVTYVGDDGVINLDQRFDGDKVRYIGCGGSVLQSHKPSS